MDLKKNAPPGLVFDSDPPSERRTPAMGRWSTACHLFSLKISFVCCGGHVSITKCCFCFGNSAYGVTQRLNLPRCVGARRQKKTLPCLNTGLVWCNEKFGPSDIFRGSCLQTLSVILVKSGKNQLHQVLPGFEPGFREILVLPVVTPVRSKSRVITTTLQDHMYRG